MIRVLFISMLLASSVCSAALPTLRSEVELRSPRVKVGDLIAEELRQTLSAKVLECELMGAPQPGATRVISRSELRGILLAHGVDPSGFILPASVKLSRWSRSLSAQELRDAVQRFIAEQHLSIELEDRLQSSTPVDVDDPELKVMGFEFNRAEQLARFRFKVVNGGGNEFWISTPAKLSEGVAAPVPHSLPSSLLVTSAASKPKPRPTVLVHTTKTATLTVSGEGFQFTTQVRPLQNGAAGEVIPVREEQTGKIFHAAVIGPQQLQIGQQVAIAQ